jgi:DNA replication initiation complex subunit (GINS family)
MYLNSLEPLHNIIIYFFKIICDKLIDKSNFNSKSETKKKMMEELNNLYEDINEINTKNELNDKDRCSPREQDELYNLLHEMNNVFMNLEKQKEILDSYK